MIESESSICYKRNYLTEVIARIDLVSPIEQLKEKLPKAISSKALNYFPIFEPSRAITQNVVLQQNNVTSNSEEFTEWNFFGLNRKNRLTIKPDTFFIDVLEYERYDNLREQLIQFQKSFFDYFPDAQPNRIGLRYINQLEFPLSNILGWEEFVNDDLLGLLKFSNNLDSRPVRIFHNFEMAIEDFNLRFQFGIHNPDYPAPIRRNVFVLDYDAFYQGLIDTNDIPEMLDRFHSKIQNFFEISITNTLREKMDGRE